ncbi:MAG: aldo/keto reductase [bacterium]|nr:aldo/keto reductase [bacterium]
MALLEIRRLGRTEMKPKALALGCAFFGPKDSVTDKDAVDGVRRAIELGLNYVDTSPLYGESERRVGLALAGGYRERVYLQTKTGTHPERRHDYSAEATRWSVENSLKLLKTDYLDAVLIHDPRDIEAPFKSGAALDTLIKMKDEGIVRHIGIGVREHDFHRRAIETGHIDIVLTYLDYTLLSQSVAETTLPLARERDVGVILASVQGMGLLAGARPDLEMAERRYPGKGQMAIAMWDWCHSRGIHLRQMALQFCLAAPINGMVMAGPANKQQVEEVISAATADLDRDLWRDFKADFGVGI